MNCEDCRDEQAREGDTIGHLLHLMTGRAQGRRGDIRPAVVVDNDTDRDVDRRHSGLAHEQRSSIEARVGHLSLDVEVRGDAAEGEDQRGHGRDGAGKVGRVGELEVGDPDSLLGSGGRAFLNADSNSKDEDWWEMSARSRDQGLFRTQRTRGDDAADAEPGEPADFAQCSDTGEEEANDRGNNHKDGCACCVC